MLIWKNEVDLGRKLEEFRMPQAPAANVTHYCMRSGIAFKILRLKTNAATRTPQRLQEIVSRMWGCPALHSVYRRAQSYRAVRLFDLCWF